jgi:hypothetical protein
VKKLVLTLATLAISLGLGWAATAGAAPAKQVINHQFCFAARPHLCMATLHAGVNSSIVLRVNGHTAAQAITFDHGRLRIKGHPGNLCIGTERHLVEARSAHCNGGHGIRWRLIVFPGRGIGFDNVAADRADPGPRQHFLMAPQIRGAILAIGTNLRIPHIWRDCAGHCATRGSNAYA